MELEPLQSTFAEELLSKKEGEAFDWLTPISRARFGLYRGNLLAHWRNALHSAYPVIEQLCGADCFTGWARAYGRTWTTADANLNLFGQGFPEFLRIQANDYPYFPDVAALEWALHLAYYAADTSPLSLQQFAEASHLGWANLQLLPSPHATLTVSQWDVAAIWQAHQPTTQSGWGEALERSGCHLVWRQRWHPRVRSVDAAEYAALRALFDGQSIESAFGAALEILPAFDVAAHLCAWIEQGIFIEIEKRQT